MSSYTPIRRPNFSSPEFRSGAAIDVHVKADIAALHDSLMVRHIAGELPADFNIDALIEKVTNTARHLRVLENVTVRDSKACQERRDWHYSTRVDPQVVDPLPADVFVQVYNVTSRRARITVLLQVNPADPRPTLDITVDGASQQLGFDGDYATLYAARALDADLRKLTA